MLSNSSTLVLLFIRLPWCCFATATVAVLEPRVGPVQVIEVGPVQTSELNPRERSKVDIRTTLLASC